MSRRRAFISSVMGVLALTITGIGIPPVAVAHSNQVSSTPAADAVLDEAPDEVTVTFDADLIDVGTAIIVRSADGVTVSAGDPVVHRAAITVATDPAALPGVYTVAYRVLSKDGHPITSSFTYTVSGTPESASADAPTPTAASVEPSTSASSAAPSSAATPVAAQHTDDTGGAPVLGIAIAVVLLGLLAVIGAVALKR